MLEINENGRIFGEEIHSKIESKTNNYSLWVKRKIFDADLIEGKDFFTKLLKSTGGRQKSIYEFTQDAAKEICMLERNNKGKEIRRWLIGLSNQKENLEVLTIPEIAFSVKVINCLKYIDNQKEALSIHRDQFTNGSTDKNVFIQFNKMRSNITGWNKEKVNNAIDKFLEDNHGSRAKLHKKNMTEQLGIINIHEAIRVACIDVLFTKGEGHELTLKFAEMIKKLSKEMGIVGHQKNENNLFQAKENVDIKELFITS